jgi:alkylation response protein AidB-like acyl-CoA dehydrogenase
MYTPPLNDIRFVLNHLIGLEKLAALPGCDQVSEDLVSAILEEAGKLAAESFAPLNQKGDKEGLKFFNGEIKTPAGSKEAYQLYVEGGWNGLPFEEAHGGQGLPFTLAIAVQEMLQSANLSLALCTLLNQGAIELLAAHGTQTQQKKYLPKMVSGAWSGTMNLTEPQAGSDVGAVRSKAWKEGDGYRVQGQKIFISYGEHDLSENIIHLVLARLPDAPAGTKGLSLFLVPKILVKNDGSLGEKNDARCVSIEHKLGQHASPACTMAFGDKGGAVAELVGRENGGIEAMFVMMNNARLGVGIQGLALCERATQEAAQFARERVQSRPIQNPKAEPVKIIDHPDVRRMLLTMRSQTQAARALAYGAAFAADQAKRGKDAEAQARVDLLTPIVKSWLTDLANEITSMGVQVYGGMGFVEETGVAQHMRDARVLAIYEGTNGIQANDLLFRKVVRDGGKALSVYVSEMQAIVKALRQEKGDDAATIGNYLAIAIDHVERATTHLLKAAKEDMQVAALAASPYLRLCATTAGGAEMGKLFLAANAALREGSVFPASELEATIIRARFYAESILPLTGGLLPVILAPQTGVLGLLPEQF